MIRVTTLFASGAGASAAYYTGYLTKADGEFGRVGRVPSPGTRLVR